MLGAPSFYLRKANLTRADATWAALLALANFRHGGPSSARFPAPYAPTRCSCRRPQARHHHAAGPGSQGGGQRVTDR
jgi:hypothetical protein